MKKFLILGHVNAATYKNVFPLLRSGRIIPGLSINGGGRWFLVSSDYSSNDIDIKTKSKMLRVRGVMWFTNLVSTNDRPFIDLTKHYDESIYNKYDNYDAIEVSNVVDIPMDYYGLMGIPITFIPKWNPRQFELIGHEHDLDGIGSSIGSFMLNGKGVFKRILIRRRK